jgi:hypothetical protein
LLFIQSDLAIASRVPAAEKIFSAVFALKIASQKIRSAQNASGQLQFANSSFCTETADD